MDNARPETGNFIERHAWQVFLALGVLFIYFGASDLTEATTYSVKVNALSGLLIGLLGSAVSVTALRGGMRWAWLTMFAWPFFGLADAYFQLEQPFATVDAAIIFELVVFVAVPLLALGLSGRRYLRTEA